MTSTDLRNRVVCALVDLGSRPEAVADRMRELGIRGDRNSETACPIAVYLDRTVGGGTPFMALYTAIHLAGDNGREGDRICDTPGAVNSFIRSFVGGAYPDLETVCGDGAR